MKRLDRPSESAAESADPLPGLILVGGGTGGHLTPGLALVEEALRRFPGLNVTFFRTRRAIEEKVLAPSGVKMEVRELELPPPGRHPLTWARFLRSCLAARASVRAEIRRARPGALVVLGGYPSLPGILAAGRENVPLVFLEQNRMPGKVVRWFRRRARAVACPDEISASLLGGSPGKGQEIFPTGNPVRRSVLDAAEARRLRSAPVDATGGRRRTILVVGGSQGARGINRAIREALPFLGRLREEIFWVHITGNADKEMLAEAYRKEGWEARVIDFAPDLPALLAGADLAITRSGGTIVSELAVIGVPAVLVPYPHHRDRHQHHNAQVLVEAGAARLIPEDRLGPEVLAGILDEILFDDHRLQEMEEAALAVSRPGAASSVLDLIVRVAGGREK